MPTEGSTEYINTLDYTKLEDKFKDLASVMDTLSTQIQASRKLRYSDVDVEAEKTTGKLQPDEIWVGQHVIDTNIRREQTAYVQYVAQSDRAIILEDLDAPANDTTLLEKDVTKKLRFDGWQLSMFPNIDCMQQNATSVLEVIQDQTKPGELAHEYVQAYDFGMPADTKDLQEAEFIARAYYFTATRLTEMCSDDKWKFSKEQVDKIIEQQPSGDERIVYDSKDRSLHKIYKVMFRVKGIVQVAWVKPDICDGWIRAPRPLYIGRRQPKQQPTIIDQIKEKLTGIPTTEPVFERAYPYFLFPYLISENNTISQMKGRAFLDQDTQVAASSLLSSYCTAHRRAAGLYFSKDTSDPNDDLLLQKNIFFKSGCLINSKVTQFQLTPPGSDMVSAINLLVAANQNETSQTNFAVNNRKDSRKTAEEIKTASAQEAKLTTVQVVLFGNSLRMMYTTMFQVIQSRVNAKLLQVSQELIPFYQRRYNVKPAGDTDVIERQATINTMMSAWSVVSNTAAATEFLADLLSLMLPARAPKYIKLIRDAQMQQQSAQEQMKQQMMGRAVQIGRGIVQLSKQPEMFSDTGKIHALPVIEQTARELEDTASAMNGQRQQ